MSQVDADVLYAKVTSLARNRSVSRRNVAQELAQADEPLRRAALRRAVAASDAQVRRAAFALIGEMRDTAFSHSLMKGVRDRSVDAAQMAIWAIGQIQLREGVAPLLELLRHIPGFKVTKTILWSLGEIGDPSVAPSFIPLLDNASARLTEGVLVCAHKLGTTIFLDTVMSLDVERATVQAVLHDVTGASANVRRTMMQAIRGEAEADRRERLLAVLGYMSLEQNDYIQLTKDHRESVRAATYRSIARARMKSAEKRRWLLSALDDEGNRVVKTALEELASLTAFSDVRARVNEMAENHPSPKIRLQAKKLLDHYAQSESIRTAIGLWGRWLLETLPGLEPFVDREARALGIQWNKLNSGNGWVEIEYVPHPSRSDRPTGDSQWIRSEAVALAGELYRLHTVARICGVAMIERTDEDGIENPRLVNPHLHSMVTTPVDEAAHEPDRTGAAFETVVIGDSSYWVATVVAERDMKRPKRELRHTSLDWRVARAMVLCSNPKPDDVCVDPTCGSGTLLLDRARFGPYTALLGGDLDPEAVAVATINVRGIHNARVVEWDAAALPLEDGKATVVLANIPFGRRVGNHETNMMLYPALVNEIARILQSGGRAVLFTQEAELLRDAIQRNDGGLHYEWDQSIAIGGLHPHLFVFHKQGDTIAREL